MTKDLTLLVYRVLLVAIFPVSAYYKITEWPFFVILGIWTRPALLGLLVYVVAATYVGHPVWRVAPEAFFGHLMDFMKNLGMGAGLLLLLVLGPGRFALQPTEPREEAPQQEPAETV
jgi:uncharacterized membrane protein YphA (DoxX/SURF4 family)